MTAPGWWPFPEPEDAPAGPATCVKCGQATWRKLNAYLGVHRGCEEVVEVARL